MAILGKNSIQRQEITLSNPGFIKTTSIIVHSPNNSKILATTCYQSPIELLLAMELIVYYLWGTLPLRWMTLLPNITNRSRLS